MKLKSNKNNNQSSIINNQLGRPTAVELVVWIYSTIVERTLQIRPFLCQTNPISERLKLTQSIYTQRVMKIKQNWGFVKTKPIKPNNQSSIIDNQLRGKPNFPQFSPENEDFTKKQTQYKANSKPILAQKRGWQSQTNPIKANFKRFFTKIGSYQ